MSLNIKQAKWFALELRGLCYSTFEPQLHSDQRGRRYGRWLLERIIETPDDILDIGDVLFDLGFCVSLSIERRDFDGAAASALMAKAMAFDMKIEGGITWSPTVARLTGKATSEVKDDPVKKAE